MNPTSQPQLPPTKIKIVLKPYTQRPEKSTKINDSTTPILKYIYLVYQDDTFFGSQKRLCYVCRTIEDAHKRFAQLFLKIYHDEKEDTYDLFHQIHKYHKFKEFMRKTGNQYLHVIETGEMTKYQQFKKIKDDWNYGRHTGQLNQDALCLMEAYQTLKDDENQADDEGEEEKKKKKKEIHQEENFLNFETIYEYLLESETWELDNKTEDGSSPRLFIKKEEIDDGTN